MGWVGLGWVTENGPTAVSELHTPNAPSEIIYYMATNFTIKDE